MFWGAVLVLAGLLLLGHEIDLIPGSFWDFFWPILLIALGIKVLFDRKSNSKDE